MKPELCRMTVRMDVEWETKQSPLKIVHDCRLHEHAKCCYLAKEGNTCFFLIQDFFCAIEPRRTQKAYLGGSFCLTSSILIIIIFISLCLHRPGSRKGGITRHDRRVYRIGVPNATPRMPGRSTQ